MATWLRTGTANLTNNSATVTFNDVDIIASNVRIGDTFYDPVAEKSYEITSIVSSTEATIAPVYAGTTNASQSYAIKPTRGIIQYLYVQVTDLIVSVQSHLDGVLSGKFGDGSSSEPGIAFASEPGLGFRRKSAGVVALSGALDRLTVSAGSGDGIFVEDVSSPGSSPFVKVRGRRSDANTSPSFSGKLLLDGNRTDAAVNTNKTLGTLAFGGNHTDGSAANILYPASISGTSEGTFSDATTMPTALTFYTGSTGRVDTTANVTFGTERMRITSTGNVGIGTNNPAEMLEVGGDARIHGLTVGRGAGGISANTAVGSGALSSNTTGGDNTANGMNALRDNTTGNNNTAVGSGALSSNTTGSANTAVGSGALSSNTTSNNNTANGINALRGNTTGNNNTANGMNALRGNTTGNNNTANGRDALFSNTTGGSNTANGFNALLNNTTGNNNTANGFLALQDNTTGGDNTANGRDALQDNTTGGSNTANGRDALRFNTTGTANTANGREALRENTTGGSNTANGINALRDNTTGGGNTANGRDALFSNTTGNDNTANGINALRDNTEGSNNIGIGLNAGRSTSPRTITTASNEICIGNNDHTGAFIKIAFTVTSDARDKVAFATIPHGLDFVNALKPTEYQFKAGGRDGEADGIRRYGFLAQDVLAAEGDTPVIVNNDDPDSLKMTHDYLIPVLVNAVKELTAQVNDLMAEVAALKGQ